VMSEAPTALELPWQELQSSLRAFIARRVGRQADVDDLVQRVLLQIVIGLDSLREAERLHVWVYRVARNVIVDYYRSPTVRRELASGDAVDLMTVADTKRPAPVEDERDALRELATCLAPMIRQLPFPYQDAIRMTDLEGLTQADAARRADISVSGMKSRVQRARQQLRAIIDTCCRVELDRRGSITSYVPRRPKACDCGDCR
jgi:RNA polymerase sigma-70 factor, ECF subfamily